MVEYVGLDVSKEETAYCVMDRDGNVLARGKAASDPQALFEALKEPCPCPERIVMETGTLSHWLVRELRARGMPVELIDARQAHAVMKLQHNKTDAGDAELLAEIARTGFCRPVAVKSEDAQGDRILLKARAHLVGQRRDMENTIRGLLASLGHRFREGRRQVCRPGGGDPGGSSGSRGGHRASAPRPRRPGGFPRAAGQGSHGVREG